MELASATESVRIISSDGIEITVPDRLVVCSIKLRRKSVLGPIAMPYTGEELSNIIALCMDHLSTGKHQQMDSRSIEILEEIGLMDIVERQQTHTCQIASDSVNSTQKYSLEGCPHHHQPQSNVLFNIDNTNSVTNTTNLPLVTLKQFLANDGSDGHRLWILIDTIVFDVTGYLSKHPGGKAPLLKGAGRDSTLQFYQHHGRKGNTRPLFNRLKTLAVGRMSLSDLHHVPGYHKLETEECSNPSLRKQFLQYFHVIE